MEASDWLTIVAAAALGAFTVALIFVLIQVFRLLGTMSDLVRTMSEQTVPLLGGVNETISGVNVELARVDTIVAGVQNITETADSMVGVLHLAVSNPIIKVAAYTSGAARGLKKLRG